MLRAYFNQGKNAVGFVSSGSFGSREYGYRMNVDNITEVLMGKLPDNVTPAKEQKVQQLFEQYNDINFREVYNIRGTTLVEHNIDTGDHQPIRQCLRRHPVAHLTLSDEQIDEILRNDLLEPAASPWASNVQLIRKKNGSMRICEDYRSVSTVT